MSLKSSEKSVLLLIASLWISFGFTYVDSLGAASNFSLSSPRFSPKGNLAFDVQGATNETGIFEISPNLIDWAGVDSFALTNGSNTFFLQPAAETLFCRTRIAEKQEAPRPAAFTARINPDFRKTVFVAETGDSMRLTDDNGFVYEVIVGPDPLLNPDDFVLEAVNDTFGLSGFEYLGGIRLSPAAISFFGTATLTITAPAGTDLSQLVALAWEQNGSELHLAPRFIDGLKVTIPLTHTGGFGIARITDTNASTVLDSWPTQTSRQIEHSAARAQLQLPDLQQAIPFTRAKTQRAVSNPCHNLEWLKIIVDITVTPRLRAAMASDATLEIGLSNYRDSTALIPDLETDLSEPCNASLAALLDQTDNLALAALDSSIERAVVHCRQKDLRALVRLYRDVELTRVGRWSRKLSLSQSEHYNQLFLEYAQFSIEILSSISYSTAAGTIRSSVSAHFPVHATDEGGTLRIEGSGELSMDSSVWMDAPSVCSTRSTLSSGTAAVNHLYLLGINVDLSRFVQTDDDIKRPQYGLLIDPFAVVPDENWVLTCEGRAIPQASFWGGVFGGFHQNEIKKMRDGRHALFIKNFVYNSDREPEKREYQNIGIVAGGDSSETTDIYIDFTGGN